MYANPVDILVEYPLDPNTLTFTGLVSGSDVVVYSAGTTTVRASVDNNSGSTWAYTYNDYGTTVDIAIYRPGYKDLHVKGYTLPNASSSLPISQLADRVYA